MNFGTFHYEPLPWPSALSDQIALVRGVISQTAWQQTDSAKPTKA